MQPEHTDYLSNMLWENGKKPKRNGLFSRLDLINLRTVLSRMNIAV